MEEITHNLNACSEGDSKVADELLPLVYEELRQLAAARMAGERPGQTLQATALVHEVWLRVTADGNRRWKNRSHFFAAATEAMRRILIDKARRKQRLRHGGGQERVGSDLVEFSGSTREDQLLRVHEALEVFEKVEPEKAQVVKFKYFFGLTIRETAEAMEVSFSTAERYWLYSKAWLFDYIRDKE